MRSFRYTFLVIALLALIGCAPSVTELISKSYPPIAYNSQVYLFETYQKVLEGGEELGEIRIMDSGFSTNCSYEEVIAAAKIAAREVGGNAILIVDHSFPSLWSSCHQIVVEVYRVDNIDELMRESDEK